MRACLRLRALAATALLWLAPTAPAHACGVSATEQGAGATHGMTGAMHGIRVVTSAQARRHMNPADDDAGCRRESASAAMRDAAGRLTIGAGLRKSGDGRAEIHQDLTINAYRSSAMQVNVMGRNKVRDDDRSTAVGVQPTFNVLGVDVASNVEHKWRSNDRNGASRAGVTVGRQMQFRAAAERVRGDYYRELGASARTARPVGPLAELSGSARWEMDRRRYSLGVGVKVGKRTRVNVSHSGALDSINRRDATVGLGLETGGSNFSVGASSRFKGTRATTAEIRARYRF